MSDRSPVGARDVSDTETPAKGLGPLFKANACSQLGQRDRAPHQLAHERGLERVQQAEFEVDVEPCEDSPV